MASLPKSRMELLPKEVSMNILSRLPAESLGKSKCVRKEWKNIISDPFFKSLHRERSSQKPNFLLLQGEVQVDPFDRERFTIVDMSSVDFDGNLNFETTFGVGASVFHFLPSKGELICLVSDGGFHVCNPSTQELVDLFKDDRVVGHAFGYIKERNEYVLFGAYSGKGDNRCEIMRWTDDCCLKNISWNVVDAKCPHLEPNAVLVENCFYWTGYDREKYDGLLIVSFDLEKEEFGTMVPQGGVSLDPCLVELKGMLCLADSPEDKSTMDIWVLKDYENHTWVKEYTIDLSMFNLASKFIIPLGYNEGKILMNVKSRSLVWYDLKNKCFTRIFKNNQISGGRRKGGWCWSGLYTDGTLRLGRT